ncbi:o-succinylbenzoate--CoA ligase [Spirabiliibacterium falconis]|uniref:o-succinylbenzoate--CoA ligase n=1 Tax=Spirabiliibacterium falconis TaxID=572023 RepID=UPI001AACAB75|nr:o-succinylbenzoate--CoA ligase [Spirabiliibacterium falconis]MBE2893737.1 o-succinylbenzoate--CoA ligase [Spirabiliibacterium falconis]
MMSEPILPPDLHAFYAQLRRLRHSDAIACTFGSIKASSIDNLLFSSGVLRWRELLTALDGFCAALITQGVTHNSGVALIGKNSLTQLLLYLASLAVGARVMVINPDFPLAKIQRICTDNQLAYYWAETALELNIPQLMPELKAQSAVWAWEKGLTMTLSSGSTGTPKAIVHNVLAHIANADGVCERMAFTAQHSWLYSLPLFHVSGQGIVWRWLTQGAKLIFPSDDLVNDITRSSHCSLVPTQLWRYLQQKTNRQSVLGQCQAVLLGGAYLDPILCQQASQQGLSIFRGYGMTEMASTIYIERDDEKPHFGLLRGRELRIEQGEIWVRGAGLALGVWQHGKIMPIVNAQGWLQTRDSGYFDGERLNITGRMDNMFICGGENVQPEEIERILYQTGLVHQAYVVGQMDAEFGHKVVAFVQFKQADFALQSRLLAQQICGKLERFKQPIAYYPLPDTTSGAIKVSRAALQKLLPVLSRKKDDYV